MKKTNNTTQTTMNHTGCRRGVVLIVVLLILVVLSAITASLSVRVAQARRRQNYMIDYQKARYACDSAMKYAMVVIPEWNFTPVNREGVPDFSDLFAMNSQQYENYIYYWLANADQEMIDKIIQEEAEPEEDFSLDEEDSDFKLADLIGKLVSKMSMSEEEIMAQNERELAAERAVDPNQIKIPGPYWVSWPYTTKPMEMEMGSARVTITVEDENAKLPLSWLLLTKDKRAQAALQHFCDWMQMTDAEVGHFKRQLETIAKTKPYALPSKSILLKARSSQTKAKKTTPTARGRTTITRRRSSRTAPKPAVQPKSELDIALTAATDFSKLYRSSLLDTEMLARSLPEMGDRDVSPLRYLGLWGSDQVNINTAPRHVLEATFIFVGKAEEIADEIIQLRREKPIRSTKELREALFQYANEIDKAAPFITTQSVFFQIRVDSHSGNAHCSAVSGVFKDRKNVKTMAMFYSR